MFPYDHGERTIKVNFKSLDPKAVLPKYAKLGDAGLDLTAVSKEWDEEKGLLKFGFGLAVEIPDGYVGLIFPRSSICKTPLMLKNAVGVIDSGYRGEIKAFFDSGGRPRKNYEVGDKIAQMIIIPIPYIEPEWTDELSSTDRGEGGFGSSGR